MKLSRTRLAAFVAALGILTCGLHQAAAVDNMWTGPAGGSWNVDGNWISINGSFIPDARGGINERAIIGSDNPAAALNGSAVLASSPTGGASPGGILLGYRQRDATTGAFVNAAPAAGTLVGSLTISGGTLNSVAGSAPGVDGRVQVGVDGRGYLTMTGGTLNATGLVVGGENITTGAGLSTVRMSGNSAINVTTGTGSLVFGGNLHMIGPNARINTNRQIRFQGSGTYTAEITGAQPTASIVTSAPVTRGAGINAIFNGVTPTPGQTWNLIDATGFAGNFSNLGAGGDVSVTGAGPAVVGAAFRLREANGGTNGKLLQLSYEKLLVLRVNRDTGELQITNPLGGAISIDGYTVSSPRGSLLTSYKGISGAPAADALWQKFGLSANNLTELKNDPAHSASVLNLTSIPSVTLGTGFSKTAVASNVANFGQSGEDLTFDYTFPEGGIVRGQVEYIGTPFLNNLVLRVNPNTGAAFLKNDSQLTLSFDGYSILSSTNSLSSAGWTGIGGAWQESQPPTAAALTETNPTGSLTLLPGASVSIGSIGAMTTAAAQAGLSMQFILSTGILPNTAADFDADSDVDGADFLTWQRNVGLASGATKTQGDANADGAVNAADLAVWRSTFGGGGGNPPETTFRVGTVLFDATAGVAVSSAVPEPSAAGLALWGMGAVAMATYRRRLHPRSQSRGPAPRRRLGIVGVNLMSRSLRYRLAMLAALVVSLMATTPVQAVTQGISLTNGRFELPGPLNIKTVAFDASGVPIPGIIPGWTFSGPGTELFGDMVPGDSGTEGGGSPGNEMLLSTFDGTVFQTASGFTISQVPATQQYRLSFDAHDIFTIDANNQQFPTSQNQLTVRLYFGPSRTTLGAPLVISGVPGAATNYTLTIPGGSAALTTAAGQSIGVEFDTTSNDANPAVAHSWAGIDDVLLQISGVLDGDLDGDGVINLSDYTILRDNLQEAHDYLAEGELTGDGLVNLNDFRAWKSLSTVVASGVLSQIAVPEPTAAGLAALALASIVGNRLRRAWVSRRVAATLAGLAVVAMSILAAPKASATLLAYDPIQLGANPAAGEYTLGAVVAGQNPTIGPASPSFFRDPWFSAVGVDTQVVDGASLSFLGSPSTGGSINGFGRTSRFLNVGWDDSTTGTFYMGFQINFGMIAPGGEMGYRAFETYPIGVNPGENRNGDIGYNEYFSSFGQAQQRAATAHMQFNIGGQQLVDGGPDTYAEDGATHLVVLKFVFSGIAGDGLDQVYMYLDPTTATEPVIASASRVGDASNPFNFTLGAIGPASFGSAIAGTTTVFDELRVGSTFADVVPPFPTPGDTNGDGLVDMTDFAAISSHMNLTGQTTANGDVTGDGRVTIADFRLWRDNRTDVGPAVPAGGGVPEPSGAVLALLAALAMAGAAIRTL